MKIPLGYIAVTVAMGEQVSSKKSLTCPFLDDGIEDDRFR